MSLVRRFIVVLTAGLVMLSGAPAQGQYAQDSLGFDLGHVFELEYASDPQIAPDGEQVVYARTFMDEMDDRRVSRLWVVGADGAGHRPITAPDVNASQPRWSPSGDRVAYVASTDEGAEIYVRWMDSGQTARLTQLEESPSSLSWGPDGERLAFTMFVERKTTPFAKMPSPPEGAEWAEQPDYIDQTYYRSDGGGYEEEGYTQVFTLSATGGTPRQLTSAPYDHGGTPEWTPDGETLLLSANRHEDWRLDPLNTELYAIDVASGAVTALTSRQGPDGDVAVSPDGDRIAYTGFDDREQGYQVTKLYVMNRDGSNQRLLTEGFERDVQDPTFTADGNHIVFQYDDEGSTKIGRVTLDGERSVVAESVGGTSIGRPYTSGSFSLAADGRVAYTHATTQRPADVAVARPGQEAQVLTSLNDDLFDQVKIGSVEQMTYESSYDGKTIEGWIVKPPTSTPRRTTRSCWRFTAGPSPRTARISQRRSSSTLPPATWCSTPIRAAPPATGKNLGMPFTTIIRGTTSTTSCPASTRSWNGGTWTKTGCTSPAEVGAVCSRPGSWGTPTASARP